YRPEAIRRAQRVEHPGGSVARAVDRDRDFEVLRWQRLLGKCIEQAPERPRPIARRHDDADGEPVTHRAPPSTAGPAAGSGYGVATASEKRRREFGPWTRARLPWPKTNR